MTTNPIELWYSTDKKLKEVIDRLSISGLSEYEQAKKAFYELSKIYNLHKYPDDITEKDFNRFEKKGIYNPRTIFEEIGILRFLEPNDDIRGIVLCAIYNVKNRNYTDIDFCALKYFGSEEKIPESYMVYYTGEDIDSKLNFLKDGESWTKEGVKYASKLIKVNVQ